MHGRGWARRRKSAPSGACKCEPSMAETTDAVRSTANRTMVDPAEVPDKIVEARRPRPRWQCTWLERFHQKTVVADWNGGGARQKRKDTSFTIRIIYTECGKYCSYRGVFLVAHTSKGLLKITTRRLSTYTARPKG